MSDWGATFKQRFGKSRLEYVQEHKEGEGAVVEDVASGDDWGHLNADFTDTIQNVSSASSKVAARALKGRTKDGHASMGPKAEGIVKNGEAEDEGRPANSALYPTSS